MHSMGLGAVEYKVQDRMSVIAEHFIYDSHNNIERSRKVISMLNLQGTYSLEQSWVYQQSVNSRTGT